jgi:hypothetical protein
VHAIDAPADEGLAILRAHNSPATRLHNMTERQTLPQRRHCETFQIEFWKQNWNVTVGYYGDHKTVGEIFINATKTTGTDLDAACRDSAVLTSLALQHGCPLSIMKGAVTRNVDGSPSSIVGAIIDRLMP